MKALSIRQPWAWAIIAGHKPVENRTRRTSHRGPLLIHASKTYDHDGHRFIEDEMGIKVPDDLPTGGIIGKVELKTICDAGGHDTPTKTSRTRSRPYASPWLFGPWGYVLENPEPMEFKPYRGMLGFFEVNEDDLS